MSLTIDDVLAIPKKTEMVLYPPGAGGDFFCTLIAMSCRETREIIIPESRDSDGKRYHGKLPSTWYTLPELLHPVLRYQPPNYITSPAISIKSLEETFRWFTPESLQMAEALKHILYTSILNWAREKNISPNGAYGSLFTPEDWLAALKDCLGEVLVLVPMHRLHWSSEYHTALDIPESPWTTLNITPQSAEGRGVTDLGHQIFFRRIRQPDENYSVIEGVGDVHFPFYDYLVLEDYNGIIKWVKQHYSDTIDEVYMKDELHRYFQHRVGPILDLYESGWQTDDVWKNHVEHGVK